MQPVACTLAVADVIGKLSSVAAIQKGPDRRQAFAGCRGNRGRGQRPGCGRLLAHGSPEAPALVLGFGDAFLKRGHSGFLIAFRSTD